MAAAVAKSETKRTNKNNGGIVMKQEDKELLLKDLCARLPYGVKVQDDMGRCYALQIGNSYLIDLFYGNGDYVDVPIKPYLRPMSSMTGEESKEYRKTQITKWVKSVDCTGGGYYEHRDTLKTFDWLNEHHFDYRGLIPKDLAIEVTEDNNPYK